MPQRFLKPGLLTSRKWDALCWLGQSFYVRLIPLVDDYGRYDGDAAILKSHAFPLREDIRTDKISALCRDLAAAGLALFFRSPDGKEYLQLTGWTEKPRADKSRYPAYDKETCKQMFADVCKCLSSPSPSSIPVLDHRSPPSTRTREGVRLYGIPSSVAEVMAVGTTLNPKVSEQTCRDFWAFYEGIARTNANGEIFWVTSGENGSVITNWKAKLPRFGAQTNGKHRNTDNPRNAGIAGDTEESSRRIAAKVAAMQHRK